MNKTLKKVIIPLALILTLVLSLAGCESADEKAKREAEERIQQAIDNMPENSEVVLSVNGEELNVEDMRYFIYVSAMTTLSEDDENFSGNLDGIDWNKTLNSGEVLSDAVKNTAIDQAVRTMIVPQKAKEKGYALEQETIDKNETAITGMIEQSGEEALLKKLKKQMGVESIDSFRRLYKMMSEFEGASTQISNDFPAYFPDTSVLDGKESTEGATVQHVLIMNETEKGDAATVANEVLQKANAGEDFTALLKQYNEDTGETEQGYTFGSGEMVPEFENAAFALKFGEISDVVQSEYGYHVIKRNPGLYDAVNYWEETADIQINSDVWNKMSVEAIMDGIKNA